MRSEATRDQESPWLDAVRSDPDATWRELIAACPPSLASSVALLPHRIGIAGDPNGGWREYVNHPLMLALPAAFASELPRDSSDTTLWVRAHHCAGFYGLVLDRAADGQAPNEEPKHHELQCLLEAWRDALSSACRDRATASRFIDEARARWQRGNQAGDPRASSGRVDLRAYGETTRDKCAYLWTATGAMLELSGVSPARSRQCNEMFERVMVAFQCFDDVRDRDEDRALRGASTSEQLALSDETLLAIGGLLINRIPSLQPPVPFERSLRGALDEALSMVDRPRLNAAMFAAFLLTPSLEKKV